MHFLSANQQCQSSAGDMRFRVQIQVIYRGRSSRRRASAWAGYDK